MPTLFIQHQGAENCGNEFTFQVDGKRYEVMSGLIARSLRLVNDDEMPGYQLLVFDEERNLVLSTSTERGHSMDPIRAYVDIDGKVYIVFSNWDTGLGTRYLDELMSSHILEINMENFTVENRYDFGAGILALTVHDGYVYTLEDGRIYRSKTDNLEEKECMADLGYRGIPNGKKIEDLNFNVKIDGVEVMGYIPDDETLIGVREETLAYIKYTDEPIEDEKE